MASGSRWRAAIERAWWTPGLSGWRLLSWPLAAFYRLLWHLRARAYDTGLFRTTRLPVPVVVVGNLIVGGTGKTPCVIALARAMRAAGWSPGIVSRGHGSTGKAPQAVEVSSSAQEVGDEPLLMRRHCGVPVWIGRDRASTALALCRAHPGVNVLIADDGLQHHSLHRDAQLVLFDDRGIGNGALLPAGPLREPMWARVPEHSLVLYNAQRPSTALAGDLLKRRIDLLLPLKAWWAGDLAAALKPEQLRAGPLIAAAGIGHPERFFSMLEKTGLRFQRLPLADHAPLEPRPWPGDAPCVIVTEKDAVKLLPTAPDADHIVVATLDLELPSAVMDALRRWLVVPPRA